MRDMQFAAVECKSRRVKLPICVCTGGQTACLNKVSWKALAPDVDLTCWDTTDSLPGKIHGVHARIHFGQNATQGLNMVGHEWLRQAGLILIADYRGMGCVLLESTAEAQILHSCPTWLN